MPSRTLWDRLAEPVAGLGLVLFLLAVGLVVAWIEGG